MCGRLPLVALAGTQLTSLALQQKEGATANRAITLGRATLKASIIAVLPFVEVVATRVLRVDDRRRPIAAFTADGAVLMELLDELSPADGAGDNGVEGRTAKAGAEERAKAGDAGCGNMSSCMHLSLFSRTVEVCTAIAGEGETAKAGDAGRGDMGSFTPPSSLPDDGDRGRTVMAGGAVVLEGMSWSGGSVYFCRTGLLVRRGETAKAGRRGMCEVLR